MNELLKINFYVDSNYAYYIDQYLLRGVDGNCHSINWANLKQYVERFVSQKEDVRSIINKNSYFVGIGAPSDTPRQTFYNRLEYAGIERKSFPLKMTINENSRLGLKEDAIDTTLVFTASKDFYSVPKEDRYDYMVLFAGDSDFVPLVDGLRSEGVKSIIIYYDFFTPMKTTRASQILLNKADSVISLEALHKDRVDENAKAVFDFKGTAEPSPRLMMANQMPRHASDNLAATISYDTIVNAISMCRKDDEGYVLVARVGIAIEHLTRQKIHGNIKLKDIISAYPDKLETKELPAYSVRVRNGA